MAGISVGNSVGASIGRHVPQVSQAFTAFLGMHRDRVFTVVVVVRSKRHIVTFLVSSLGTQASVHVCRRREASAVVTGKEERASPCSCCCSLLLCLSVQVQDPAHLVSCELG